ncbi:MAG: hypothetical protein JJE45_00265 [Prolixibacteraceae bacterium]|nr:hypothetical protein [Prolixibacteraceae bacterium]
MTKIEEKQEELIKALSKMLDWDNYPTDRLDEYYELLSEIEQLKSQEQPVTDEMIENWAEKISLLTSKLMSFEQALIEGAKALRDNKIK